MLVLIKEMFIGLLISIDDASNHTKCVSLSNQKFEIQPTFINLHPKKYSQEFHYYPFTVKLAKCVESNTLNDLSNKVCDPNKTEDVNLDIFNMITGTDESKTLKKHISCECKCRFDDLMEEIVIQINGGIMINANMSVRNIIYVKDIMFGILQRVIVKMENI